MILKKFKIQNLKFKINDVFLQKTFNFLPVFLIFNFCLFTFIRTTYAAECIPGDPLGCGPAGVGDVETLFSRILNISVGAAFVALVVVLVVAGIKFITSGGDAKSLSAASQAIVWGLLGILFMAIAWLILQLIAAFTGIDALTSFNLQVLIPKNSP